MTGVPFGGVLSRYLLENMGVQRTPFRLAKRFFDIEYVLGSGCSKPPTNTSFRAYIDWTHSCSPSSDYNRS